MQAKRLPDDVVEVWERHEIIHRRAVGCNREEFLTELGLDVRTLRKREQAPHCFRARRLVARNQEGRDLWNYIQLGLIFRVVSVNARRTG